MSTRRIRSTTPVFPSIALLLGAVFLFGCTAELGDESLDEDEVVSVTEEGLSFSGWHAGPKNCDSLPGTGGIFSDAEACAQVFIQIKDGQSRGRIAAWVNNAYVEFYDGDNDVILQKASGLKIAEAACFRNDFGLSKYKAGDKPLDLWTCTTLPTPIKGLIRVKGSFCFDVKGDGHGDKCVKAPATGYYKNN